MGKKHSIADFIADRGPVCFAATDTVTAAVASMKEHKSDCVLVCESQVVTGVFTQRDFLVRVAAAGKSDAQLGAVMTKEPATMKASDDIAVAIHRMAVGNYRNIPVVDEGGRAVANLSVWDVMRHLADRFAGDLAELGAATIDALFQRPAVEVEPGDQLLSVLNLMVQRACGAVRVQEGDRLLGIFAEQDLMHRVNYASTEWHTIPVSEIMTRDPLCIEHATTIAEALRTMNENRFRHLPVVQASPTENTRLVSIRELLGYVASRKGA